MFSFLRRPSTPEITVEELDELRRDRAVRILDVRADWEFKRGHVPAAVHVPLKQLSARAGTLPHGGRYVVICQPAVGAEAQRTTSSLRDSTARSRFAAAPGVGTQRQAAQVRPGDRPSPDDPKRPRGAVPAPRRP